MKKILVIILSILLLISIFLLCTKSKYTSLDINIKEKEYYYSQLFKTINNNIKISSNIDTSIEIININDDKDIIQVGYLTPGYFEKIKLKKNNIYKIKSKSKDLIITLSNIEKLNNTNLSNIYLDNLSITQKLNIEDLNKYTKSDRYSYDYKYKFEEIVIDTDSYENINYLFARFDEDYIDIKVNNESLTNINDLIKILGNNYKDKNYDREQQLREYIYTDYENGIQAEFIYSENDNSLTWIILRKTK